MWMISIDHRSYVNLWIRCKLRNSFFCRASLVAQTGKHLPWIEEPGRLQSMELQRTGHDWATSLSLRLSYFTFTFYVNLANLLQNGVQFSHSVASDSLQPHEPQHTRPSFPSATPGVHPNSCPLCRWWHLTISSSVISFSSCLHLSQHQDLFKWIISSHQVAKILEFQLQHQSIQWTPRTDL